MGELRWHPFLGEWVIVAAHRQDRTFFPPDDYCPLCPTKTEGLPTEIPRGSYDVAVFENRFPSLHTPAAEPAIEDCEIMPARANEGVCEVVCYTQEHDTTLADLPISQIRKLTRVWKDRYRDLIARPEVDYVYIFENKGQEIGVTLTHPHGQIYAYPFVPKVIQDRLNMEREHYERTGRLLVEEWLDRELKEERRIVWQSERWLAVVPFFARYPYEVLLAPKRVISNIGEMDSEYLDGFAEGLKVVTQKLDRLFSVSMPYVMSLYQHDVPYTWFATEFAPRYRTAEKLKYLAGSETGCGVFINDTIPEESAARLREL